MTANSNVLLTTYANVTCEITHWYVGMSKFQRVRMIAERKFGNNLEIYDDLFRTASILFPRLKKSEVEPVVLSGTSRSGIAAIEFDPGTAPVPPILKPVDKFIDPKK
jgi:hypothetical protein